MQTPVSQIVAAELKPLGINVKIRELDPSEVTAQEQSFHFGMRETYWTMDIIDPDEYVSFVLCGSCGSFANWTHFNNAQIDKLTTQAETTFNSSARGAIYAQIQKLSSASPRSFGSATAPTRTSTAQRSTTTMSTQRAIPTSRTSGSPTETRTAAGSYGPKGTGMRRCFVT